MIDYDIVFYWIGLLSAGLFVLLGMGVFSAFVMDVIWRRFKDGKDLTDIICTWREHGAKFKDARNEDARNDKG